MTYTKTKILNSLSKNHHDLSSFISSIDNVIKSDPDDTLGSVIPLVASSHSPVYIFTKENKFLGYVSPYQALYAHRYSFSTKLSTIVSTPPYLTKETKIHDVASSMLESRIYILPLFDENKQVIGVIQTKDIFKNLIKNQDLLSFISTKVKPHTPVTANNNSTVGEVFQIMQDKDVSRVVLTDDSGVLSGIVSRKDLLNVYMKPTQKQRFGKSGNQQTNRAFDTEKEYRKTDPIKKYMTDQVNTLSNNTKQEKIINQLIGSEHNSVVLINKYNKPVGFLSLRDILSILSSLHPKDTVNIIMANPSTNVSQSDEKKAHDYLTRFAQKMQKRIAIDKIEVTFDEPKTASGESIIFNTTIIISPLAGAKIISKTKDRSFLDGIHSAIAQIEKQQRRSSISKAGSRHNSF